MKTNKIKQEWKNILFNLIFAGLNLGIVIYFYKNILLTTILVGLVAVTGLVKWKSKITLTIFIFSALFGALAEIVAISFGVWNYALPNFYNIPFWLFILWGNAAAFIYQTALEIKRLGIKK